MLILRVLVNPTLRKRVVKQALAYLVRPYLKRPVMMSDYSPNYLLNTINKMLKLLSVTIRFTLLVNLDFAFFCIINSEDTLCALANSPN